MAIENLQTETVKAHFEEARRIAFIVYEGKLSAESSGLAYDWLQQLLDEIGVETLHGVIFDFSAVREFLPDNLIDARKKSRRLNLANNDRLFPAAMIVHDTVQEEMLRGPMRNVPENRRKRIVHTEEAALAFLDEYHGVEKPA